MISRWDRSCWQGTRHDKHDDDDDDEHHTDDHCENVMRTYEQNIIVLLWDLFVTYPRQCAFSRVLLSQFERMTFIWCRRRGFLFSIVNFCEMEFPSWWLIGMANDDEKRSKHNVNMENQSMKNTLQVNFDIKSFPFDSTNENYNWKFTTVQILRI